MENQGDRSYGRVNLIKATQDSINTAYIDMTLAMPDGPKQIIRTANAMGIPPAEPASPAYGIPTSSPGLQPNTGVALGSQTVSPINMANGYATIANRGVAAEAYIIEKVVDRDGVVRFDHKLATHEALSEGISDDVGYALQQVVKAGSGSAALGLRRPAGGKTGTATNGNGEVSSAWFVGYTPQLATAVMYVRGKGNEQLKDWLPSYFGGSYPAETWTAVMTRALEGEDVESLPGRGVRQGRGAQRRPRVRAAAAPAAEEDQEAQGAEDHQDPGAGAAASASADHGGPAADHRGAADHASRDPDGASDRRQSARARLGPGRLGDPRPPHP